MFAHEWRNRNGGPPGPLPQRAVLPQPTQWTGGKAATQPKKARRCAAQSHPGWPLGWTRRHPSRSTYPCPQIPHAPAHHDSGEQDTGDDVPVQVVRLTPVPTRDCRPKMSYSTFWQIVELDEACAINRSLSQGVLTSERRRRAAPPAPCNRVRSILIHASASAARSLGHTS